MRLERSKNTIRNILFGTGSKLLTILMPFAVRTVFIYTLGAEYLGLNSLFTSILTILNLTELGFSNAIVFSMYRPIAEEDTDSINALLSFYRTVYRWVGLIILAVGLALIPLLPRLVKGGAPEDISLTAVYLVYLFNTAASYFLYGYMSALLTAYQRDDLISRVNIAVTFFKYALQIVVLLSVRDYYIYIIIMPVFTLLNNLVTALVARRVFPQHRPFGRISREQKAEVNEKVRGMFVNKVCWASRNAFDSIFISAFLGLTDTAIYNNYYFIMNSVVALMQVLYMSALSGIGNSIVTESVEKNYSDMRRMNFVYLWVAAWCTSCLLCLYQPFMLLWAGASMLFPMGVVVLMCVYFYSLMLGDIKSIYSHAAGLWWENRYRAIGEALANLLLNYFLGKRFGVYGIVAATIISLLTIDYYFGTRIVFRCYFKGQSMGKFFRENFVYLIVTVIVAGSCYFVCMLLPDDGIGAFIVKVLVCMAVPNGLMLAAYCKTAIFRESVPWLLNKFSFSRRLLRAKENG